MILTVGLKLQKKKGQKKMKKSIKRIISFALMLSLLVGMMMTGISVSATETPTVEIVSKNVYYKDTLNLMYAVRATEGYDVAVKIYNANGDLLETITESKTELVNGEDAKVFISTIGVPAQDIDTEFYAVAELSDGTKSAKVRYSVLEYLYERLTVSTNVTDAQKTMYNNLLAFADSADIVLNADDEGQPPEYTIADYAYVIVENGTVDGTYSAAMLKAGTKLNALTTTFVPGNNMELAWNIAVDGAAAEVVKNDAVAEYTIEGGKAYVVTATEVEAGISYYEKTVSLNVEEFAAANGWTNGTRYAKVNLDANLEIIVGATTTNSINSGKYYTSGNNWRFYQSDKGTITISSGDKNIVSVKITFTTGNSGILVLNGNTIDSAELVSVNAPSVTFSVSDTAEAEDKGQVLITGIEVVYEIIVHDCVYSEATCTTPKTCTICGETDGEALGHSYDEGKEDPAATCTDDGVKTFTCTVCGVTKTEVIEALGHTTDNGTCERCGETIGGTSDPETPKEKMPTTKYSFSSYTAGTQYAQGEEHQLDENTKLTINGAHLNTQVRLYAGSNCVIECDKTVEKVEVTAGYKAGTLTVYVSNDGETWTEVEAITTTTSYTAYTVDLGGSYQYVKFESAGAQIRLSILTVNP